MRKHKATFPVLLILISMLLAACGGDAASTPTTVTSSQPPAAAPTATTAAAAQPATGSNANTLKIMLVDYVKGKTDTWLEGTIFPAFEKAHPGMKVQPVYVDWSTIDATLQGYFAAGSGADIVNLGSEYGAIYGDRLANLDQYLGASAWPDINQYLTSTLTTVTWNGHITGLPWLVAPRSYMCRTDLEPPSATYQDQITNVKKATIIKNNAVQQAGLVTTGKMDDWQEFLELIQGLGANLYQANGTPTFDSPEAKAALKFMYDRRRAVYTDENVADLPTAQGSRLADGSAACLWANLWGAPLLTDTLWSKIDLSPSPVDTAAFPNSKPVVQVFSDWLAVPAYSKNQAAAADLLKMLGSAENQNHYNADFGSFPPRKDAWTGYVANSTVMQKLSSLMQQYGVAFADVRESVKLREILQKEMPAYFTDQEDETTALSNIQTQYTQVLKDAGKIK